MTTIVYALRLTRVELSRTLAKGDGMDLKRPNSVLCATCTGKLVWPHRACWPTYPGLCNRARRHGHASLSAAPRCRQAASARQVATTFISERRTAKVIAEGLPEIRIFWGRIKLGRHPLLRQVALEEFGCDIPCTSNILWPCFSPNQRAVCYREPCAKRRRTSQFQSRSRDRRLVKYDDR